MALQKSTERDNTLDMVLVFMMPKIGSKFQPIFIGSKIINLIHLHRIGRRVKTADSVQ